MNKKYKIMQLLIFVNFQEAALIVFNKLFSPKMLKTQKMDYKINKTKKLKNYREININ